MDVCRVQCQSRSGAFCIICKTMFAFHLLLIFCLILKSSQSLHSWKSSLCVNKYMAYAHMRIYCIIMHTNIICIYFSPFLFCFLFVNIHFPVASYISLCNMSNLCNNIIKCQQSCFNGKSMVCCISTSSLVNENKVAYVKFKISFIVVFKNVMK